MGKVRQGLWIFLLVILFIGLGVWGYFFVLERVAGGGTLESPVVSSGQAHLLLAGEGNLSEEDSLAHSFNSNSFPFFNTSYNYYPGDKVRATASPTGGCNPSACDTRSIKGCFGGYRASGVAGATWTHAVTWQCSKGNLILSAQCEQRCGSDQVWNGSKCMYIKNPLCKKGDPSCRQGPTRNISNGIQCGGQGTDLKETICCDYGYTLHNGQCAKEGEWKCVGGEGSTTNGRCESSGIVSGKCIEGPGYNQAYCRKINHKKTCLKHYKHDFSCPEGYNGFFIVDEYLHKIMDNEHVRYNCREDLNKARYVGDNKGLELDPHDSNICRDDNPYCYTDSKTIENGCVWIENYNAFCSRLIQEKCTSTDGCTRKEGTTTTTSPQVVCKNKEGKTIDISLCPGTQPSVKQICKTPIPKNTESEFNVLSIHSPIGHSLVGLVYRKNNSRIFMHVINETDNSLKAKEFLSKMQRSQYFTYDDYFFILPRYPKNDHQNRSLAYYNNEGLYIRYLEDTHVGVKNIQTTSVIGIVIRLENNDNDCSGNGYDSCQAYGKCYKNFLFLPIPIRSEYITDEKVRILRIAHHGSNFISVNPYGHSCDNLPDIDFGTTNYGAPDVDITRQRKFVGNR